MNTVDIATDAHKVGRTVKILDQYGNTIKTVSTAVNAMDGKLTRKLAQEGAETAVKGSGKVIPVIGTLFNLASAAYYGLWEGRGDIAALELAAAGADIGSVFAAPTGVGAVALQGVSWTAEGSAMYLAYQHEVDKLHEEQKLMREGIDRMNDKTQEVKINKNSLKYTLTD